MAETAQTGKLTLEVMISTCGPDGGRRVAAMRLPRVPRVSYLVSWQEPGEATVPEELASRDDVRIVTLSGLGLSRNRNNCLDHACGDLLMVADDDLRLYPEGLAAVIDTFERDPALEYGSFRYDSDVAKQYPSRECALTSGKLPKNFFQASVEIVIRRNSRVGRLRFHESFGLGCQEFSSGEEELLLKRARDKGVNCRFIPVSTCYHPGESTGVKPSLADGTIRARGVCTAVEYPFTAAARVPLTAWRISRSGQAPFLRALRLLSAGALKALFTPLVRHYLKAPL